MLLARPPPRPCPPRPRARALPPPRAATLDAARVATLASAESALLAAVSGVAGRGAGGLAPDADAALRAAVATLEADGGVEAPASSPEVEGRWKLIFTTRPGTASPIQRAFTARDSFSVHQEIELAREGRPQRVTNVVTLGAAGVLRVEAEASTLASPVPGFVPRRGAGLPLFGKSDTSPPADPARRIDFAFDNAYFRFAAFPSITVPYPVPFKWLQSTGLGDEVKGFIDVTFLAPRGVGRVRLSRGNKGTLFVLVREEG